MTRDMFDAIRYAVDSWKTCEECKKEKEKKSMITGKWKVVDATIEQELGGTDELHVHIMNDSGYPYGSFDDIKKVVEFKMNGPDKVYVGCARGSGKSYAQAEFYRHMVEDIYGSNSYCPEIKEVIFNDPATIVFWKDGTKTVVKCQEGDAFDPEKGLTMAIVKKVYGNKGSYCNEIKKWCEPYYEKQAELSEFKIETTLDALAEAAKSVLDKTISMKCSRKPYPGFVNVTEHYGYAYLPNLYDENHVSEYYVCHNYEKYILSVPEKRNQFFHSKNLDNAVTVAHHLEYEHYILDKGDV